MYATHNPVPFRGLDPSHQTSLLDFITPSFPNVTMSAQPTSGGGGPVARVTTNGGSTGAMPMPLPQQRPNDSTVNVSNGAQSGGMSQQNLNGIVRLLLS